MRFIFVALVCLVPFVFAIEISPAEFELSGNTGDVLCGNVLIGDVGPVVITEDRWAVEGYSGRDFLAHKLSGFDLGLDVDYEEEFIVGEKIQKRVCVSGKGAGFYHGLLLFREDGGNAGVGIWVVVDLAGPDVIAFGGMSTGSFKEDSNVALVFLLSMFFVLLMLVFVIVLKFGQTLTLKKENSRYV